MSSEKDEEEIAHPTLELYRHTLLRGANAGSLLAVLFAPPVLYFRGTKRPRELLFHTAKASLYGVVSTLLMDTLSTGKPWKFSLRVIA